MVRAVRFHEFGGADVLRVEQVGLRALGPDDVIVDVRAAGINPGETNIRTGRLEALFPTVFPCGEGSDLAGVISAVGDDVTAWQADDEVLGWTWERSSHAERAVVPASQLIRKPAALSWDVAGSLYVAGCTAFAAVRAVRAADGDTVLVSAAAGGVGTIAVQLLRLRGARVIAIASERNARWLRERGCVVVPYGDDIADRVRAAAPGGVDAAIDLFGPEYVYLAASLGVPSERINTVISFQAAADTGAKTEGSAAGTSTEILAQLAALAADGSIDVPIAARYPLDQVQDAFTVLERRHTFGKIVLVPSASP
jgi:NADPH:quinone reductase-like Zn-dependent oxidoreductase